MIFFFFLLMANKGEAASKGTLNHVSRDPFFKIFYFKIRTADRRKKKKAFLNLRHPKEGKLKVLKERMRIGTSGKDEDKTQVWLTGHFMPMKQPALRRALNMQTSTPCSNPSARTGGTTEGQRALRADAAVSQQRSNSMYVIEIALPKNKNKNQSRAF